MTEGIIVRLLGVLAGSFLALAFLPPRSISGFVRRGLSALVFGFVFAPIVHDYLQWPATDERVLASGAVSAFISWWIMGLAKRVIESYRREPE